MSDFGKQRVQREFARRVTAVEAQKTAQRASMAELGALFASSQHRAIRGELQSHQQITEGAELRS